jgi:hypothetical protein
MVHKCRLKALPFHTTLIIQLIIMSSSVAPPNTTNLAGKCGHKELMVYDVACREKLIAYIESAQLIRSELIDNLNSLHQFDDVTTAMYVRAVKSRSADDLALDAERNAQRRAKKVLDSL